MARRFLLRRSLVFQPLLLLIGWTTDARSYVELEDGRLRVRFGWLFDSTFSLSDIASVGRASWPLIGGVGWRTNFSGTIGLIGSYGGIVELRLAERQRVRGIIPFVRIPCDRLFLSLEEPDAFVAALQEQLSPAQ